MENNIQNEFQPFTYEVAVIIPVYQCTGQLTAIIKTIPSWVKHIIVIDDGNPHDLDRQIADIPDKRILLIRHAHNQGVGAAFMTGAQKAVELGAEILAKMDGDGQMDPRSLYDLIKPIMEGQADYTKGNRFFDLSALRLMPKSRMLGNLLLSFLLKVASGYWNVFDPSNGYIAMSAYLFKTIRLEKINRRFFFESSLLIQAGIQGFVVSDVPIPARYGVETSSLSAWNCLFYFPPRLIHGIGRRFFWHYLLMDFNAVSVFTLSGLVFLLGGLFFGTMTWIQNAAVPKSTPTGTIMLAVLPIIIGVQLLLQAVALDIGRIPRKPKTPLRTAKGSATKSGPRL
jgi:glycosyltransferase involved in cell wall biosynthesis